MIKKFCPRKYLLKKNWKIFFLFAFIIVITYAYNTWHYTSTPSYKLKPKKHYDDELMTQNPQHIRKQIEYKEQILANIEKMQIHKQFEQKVGSDPLGIVLHKPPSLWDGFADIASRKKEITVNGEKNIYSNSRFHRIVHIDLKGAPPKIEYLKTFLKFIKDMGATGILIEYEDMFPYWGKLESLSALNAYARGDIADLFDFARKCGLEVIPFVQTFGHLEFLLKLKEFSYLREVPNYPHTICPSNNSTLSILTSMIDQIIELHPGINWLHIGSDEVYDLGECLSCQKLLLNDKWGKSSLFLHHVNNVAHYVKDTYDIQPIMWDDEFRKIPLSVILSSGIHKNIDVMVWKYNPGIMLDLRSDIWEKYRVAFQGIWIASAFKGATHPDSFITPINERLNNHKEWIEFLNMYKKDIPVTGIVLTGWQRFDHFSVLCELLPQGIPSLVINLMYLIHQRADHTALAKVLEILNCESFIMLDLSYLDKINKCTFPGSKIYELAQRLHVALNDFNIIKRDKRIAGWFSDYNIANKFVNPRHIEQGLQDLPMLYKEFESLMHEAQEALEEVFDKYTVKEWIFTFLEKPYNEIVKMKKQKDELLLLKSWPRRPLDIYAEQDL